MPHYVGLDVSQKTTAICVVDEQGRRLWRGVCATDPGAISARVLKHAGVDAKVGVETGSMTPWLVRRTPTNRSKVGEMPSWFFTSLRGYRIAWLPRDLVAGLMLLAIALPGQLAIVRVTLDKHYRETLDQPVGMLGDITPRVAAKTKKGREKLVAWLKFLENQSARDRDRDDPMRLYDFSWMWTELGIANLRR